MTKLARDPLYRRHRFPAEVIAHAVWLYLRFPLNLRMIEDMLAAHGIIVSHQTVRVWAEKFSRRFANDIRQRSARKLGDKWHLDKVVITIGGKMHWLWLAVDQDGFVLDVLVQGCCNTGAARHLMRKLLKGQGRAPAPDDTPAIPIAHDTKPGTPRTTKKAVLQQPVKSKCQVQRFVSIHDSIASLFYIPRHDIPSDHHRKLRAEAMDIWRQIARLHAA